ncbi:MAG: LPS export ABC transporter periplasmic protein LptC [Lysobacter sp.]|nr:MAG: LPS export ABC transporter periplasmic protein LptC [Lysobacter sp.]
MSWRHALFVLLALGAVLSGWAVWKHRRPPERVVAGDARPDYVLHDFELIALDKQGKESFTLRAPNLSRSPDDETMTLTTPLFLLPNPDGDYWEVRAKRGWVGADHSEIRLEGEVKAESPADALRPVTMNTDRLSVFPDKNEARTDAVVTIVQPGSILRGRGFTVSTTTKRYVFRSEVQFTHAPTPR